MALKQYEEIQRKVIDAIDELIEKYFSRLYLEHDRDPWKERKDLERFLDEFRVLLVRARKLQEGGYTVFAYNVLIGVWHALNGLLSMLEDWIEHLKLDFTEWGDETEWDDEEEEEED